MKISEETRKWARVISALEPLKEQIRAGQLSLEQARQQLTGELRRDMEQDLARMTAEAKATAQMTDDEFKAACDEFKAEWDEIVPKEYVHSIVHSIREDAEKTIRVLEIGRRLLEKQYAPDKPAVPKAPDLFQGKDITPVPNNPYSHFVVEAIVKGGPLARFITDGWRENTIDGQPLLLKQAAPWRGGSMVAKFDPVEQQAVNAAELWARVEGLNPLTADVALAILGTLGDPRQGEKPKFPMLEPVVVTTDRILQYKGIQKWGSDRRVLQQRIAAEFKTLQDFTVEIRSIPFGKDKKGKELLVSIPRCKLFDVAEVYKEQYWLDGLVEQIPIGWAIRAGIWANYWFNSHGRMWLSGMSRVLLELDHRAVRGADVMAKKIGLLLLAVPGGTAHWNAPVTRRVERLLADIGELPEREHRGAHWANRTRERLDTALAMLQECGALVACCYSEDYPDPGDRGKGWVDRWLSASITLTAPEFVALESDKEQPVVIPPGWQRKRARLGKPRKALEPGQALDETTVNRIRQKAAARNLLLKALAEQLGVARSSFSNVLARREAPSAALAAKIRAFLDSPD